MEIRESGHEPFEGARSAMRRGRAEVSGIAGRMSLVAGDARRRADEVAERLPGVIGRVRSGARTGVTGLQRVPDAELSLLAAASIGFGAGLRLAGAPRLATLAGFAPASILGFAIFSRPRAAGLTAPGAGPSR